MPSGTWAVVSSEEDGQPSKFPTKGTLYTFTDGKVTGGPKKAEGKVLYTFKADPKKNPKEIDLIQEDDKKKVVMRSSTSWKKVVSSSASVSRAGVAKARLLRENDRPSSSPARRFSC